MLGLGLGLNKSKKRGDLPPLPPVNIVQPFLVGTGEIGENLVCNKGTWSGRPAPTYTYDFRVNSVSVQNSASNIYVPQPADEGLSITCLVQATNPSGSATEGTSNSVIAGYAPVNTALPTLDVTGNQVIGTTTITATDGTWTGTAPITYQYRWTRNGIPISGETTNTYTLQPADETATIRVQVRAINAYETTPYVTSDDSVVAGYEPMNITPPELDKQGLQLVGETITVDNDGTWLGTPTITFEYQWVRDGFDISGETNVSYTLVSADDGKNITCKVRALNNFGTSAYESTSNSVDAGTVPVNTFAPNVSGSTSLGDTLTTTDGTWSGTPTITYTYQWKRNGVDIVGETANTYVIGSSDSLANITCEVKATNSFGFNTQISNTVTVDNFAPVNTVAPTVSPNGTQSTGTVITVNVGTWSGVPTITYAYRWTRNGTPISGATTSTYTIQASDDGTTIRCEVQGSNAFGTSAYVASSNSVSAVNAIAPVNTVAPVISGTAVVGQTLSSTTGTWTGIPTPTYSYQWRRGGVDIGGATSSTYTLVSADAGTNITCRVTATNSAGSVNATSNTLAILATVLDLYPSAAAAYSVRLLRGAHYTSNAIRVRRSNDNAEQDIGFTTAGELNTTALTTFVGSNSGFIVTWYDQSGNANNATQSTPGSQARIVNAGTLDVIGTKPASLFNGTTNSYAIANTISPASGVYTAVAVVRRRATSTNFSVIGDLNTFSASLLLGQLSNRYYFQRNTGYLESPIDNTASHMILIGISASTNQIRRNGVQLTNTLLALTIANNIRTLGAYTQSAPYRLDGSLQEVVIWATDQTSNISAIESNTNTYYGIY